MPFPSTKSLSPAELAKLEHAFATDPSSEAYKPLAEAYLGMGRFMEAMVVCKKGVKAHPTLPDPRVLLSRVYSDQGKDKKALEELVAALGVAPNDKRVLRLAGALQLKTGDADAGKQNLIKAYALDETDAETLSVLKEWKIEPPAKAPPPPAPAPVVASVPDSAGRPAASAEGPPVLTPGMQPLPTPRAQARAAEASVAGHAGNSSPPPPVNGRATEAAVPQPRVPTARPRIQNHVDEDDPDHRPHRGGRRNWTLVMALLLIPVLVGYLGLSRWNALRKREVNKLLAETARELKKDSFESYRKAVEAGEQVVERDPENALGHGYLAYAWAIRFGEHGGGDDARKSAEAHLAEAMAQKEPSQYAYAADALLKSYLGRMTEAVTALDAQIKKQEASGGRPTLLHLTAGILLTNAGDFERAKDYLEKALGTVQDDPRIYSAMGTLYRRKGENSQAARNYDFALKFGNSHQESMLGQALLILDQENPNYGAASRTLKKLEESQPPPSPRQLGIARMARAYLIAKVTKNLPDYRPEDQKKIIEGTGVSQDRSTALAEANKAAKDALGAGQNPELFILNGKRLIEEGQVDQAIAQLRAAVDLDKLRAQSYIELSRAYLLKPGGEKEAQDLLIAAVKTTGSSPRLVSQLGQVYLRQGKTDEALAQFQSAVSDPRTKNPDARHSAGRIFLEKKDFAKAQEFLSKAVTELFGQSSRLAEVYADLGRAYEGLGDRAKADDVYQKGINADADYAPGYFFYARFLSTDPKSLTNAKQMAQNYLKREPKGPYAAEAQLLVDKT